MIIGITGGCGYVGSILTPLLASRVDRIELLDLKPPCPEVMVGLAPKQVQYHAVDVSRPELMQELAGRYDVILHLAALVGFPACRANPELAQRWNVVTTENLIRFKRRHARVVLASTISVYGDQREGALVTEMSETRPNSEYGITKSHAEALLMRERENVVLRFAGSFGRSPRMRHDVLIHDFIQRAARLEKVSIFENSFIRQFVHVRDMAEALLFTLEHLTQVKGEVFNVGNPRVEITKRELVGLISRHMPFPHEFEESGRDLEKRNYRVSFSKLMSVGYTPRHALEGGIAELVDYYQQSLAPHDKQKELAHVS